MPTDRDKQLLANIVASRREFIESLDKTVNIADEIDELVSEGLRGSVPSQMTAIEIMRRCPLEVRKKLLPALVRCSPSIYSYVVNAILALPSEWLIEHIEEAVYPLLDGADHIDYDCFLHLFDRINPALASRLAHNALGHSDPDVREKGAEYLAKKEAQIAQRG